MITHKKVDFVKNILEHDKKSCFSFFRLIESIVIGMAEKTDESANNLELEYEVSF